MTSKERVLNAMQSKPVDYIPLVPKFNPLAEQQRVGYRYQFPWGNSQREKIEYLVHELGTDPIVDVDVGWYEPEPGVTSQVWMEGDIIHKSWKTPSGALTSSVRYNTLWPHGFDIPFFSDFNAGHAIKPWVENETDIACLKHILRPIQDKETLARLHFYFSENQKLAHNHDLAIIAHIGMGLTGGLQLFGPSQLCLTAIRNPELVHAYVALEHQINIHSMKRAMEWGVDVIGRNGFYETADFYSPAMLQEFLKTPLQHECKVVQQNNGLIGYTVHTGVMPILEHLNSIGFDCIMNIDISFKDVDLSKIKTVLEPNHSFLIGPSNTYHMWDKDPEVVRNAVRTVFSVFNRQGLLITSCPSSHSIMPWGNTLAMVDEWKKLR